MPSRQLGPWKLAVKDRAVSSLERFIAFDGKQVAWVWRTLGEPFVTWDPLKAPWLPAVEGPRWGGEPVLLSDCLDGVTFADLIASHPRKGLPVGAVAAVALAVARGVEQLPSADDVPLVVAESIVIGFDGSVSLTPWPDLWVGPSEAPEIALEAHEYLTPRWSAAEPGWRVHAPVMVLAHALDIHQRGFPPGLRQLMDRALHIRAETRPSLTELISALVPLASSTALAEAVSLHFAHEPKEQQYDRTLAQGKDPEPLPPELVASIANEGTDEGFGVLADWLLAEGHPRGELAALQLKLEQGASTELARAEAALLSRHRSLLPVTLRERLQQWRPNWKAGWLVGLELKAVPDAETLTEILSHPTLRFLRRIRVRHDGGGSRVLADVIPTLELPALRQLELDGGVATFAPKLKEARPRLSVENNKLHPDFPARRRPETSVAHAKVGVGNREPAPGLPPLKRLMDWLSGDD
ncbi:MAG: hypothetical protein QM723_36930 [Myxococcaceae bacterium]